MTTETPRDPAPTAAEVAEATGTEPPAPAGSGASGQPAGEPAEEPMPSFTEQLADQLGGVRGVIESGIPVLVFVIANIILSLRPALIISVASAVAIGAWRLSRRQPVRHAVNGVFGIAIGGIIAWKTGSAKD